MDRSNERSAAELVSRLVDSVAVDGADGTARIVRAWSDVVGAKLAAHSDIVDIRNGALYVRVDHPAWLQLMQLRGEAIRKRIAKRAPELAIRELCLFAGQPERMPAFHRRESPRVVDEAPRTDDTAPVADPELAAALERIRTLARGRR